MNAKTLKQVLVVLFCVFTINVLEAQTPWKKELHTESDGFQWYEYTYEKNSNGNYPKAAFDLNGKQLTCNTEYLIKYIEGYFEVWVKTDSKGKHIFKGYDKQGNCIITDCLGFTYSDGFFIVENKLDVSGKCIRSLYDRQWNCIIPETYGFTTLTPDIGLSLIIANESKINEGNYLFSTDGQYYTIGYKGLGKPEEFNANKKPVSTLRTGSSAYASNSSSNSSSSYSLGTTSNSSESGLLYEGEYTIQYSQSRDLINGYSTGQYSSDETERVKIYEDHLAIHFGTHCKYKSTNSSGERVYEGAQSIGGTVTAYVSPSYNIRLVNESWFNGVHMKVGIPVVKGRSLMPEYSGGYGGGTSSGYQPTNNNNGSTGTSSGSKHGSYVKEETCPACHGTKTCETCLGRGWRNNPFTNQHDTCPICRGRKTCQTCNGSGKVSKTVYY